MSNDTIKDVVQDAMHDDDGSFSKKHPFTVWNLIWLAYPLALAVLLLVVLATISFFQ